MTQGPDTGGGKDCAMSVTRIRWGDNDRCFGPFTYARDSHWRPLALILGSGDGDEYPGCSLRLSGFGHTLIIALPPIIRPWRVKVEASTWDQATIARLGRDWYWNTGRREYGFTYSEGHLSLALGRVTHDSSTEQRWGCFLPWTQWRHVRHSLYGLDGEHVHTYPLKRDWRAPDPKDDCPSRTFAFADFDGERLVARTVIEEREWRFGEGWFRWLSWFRAPRVSRSLDIRFSGETGRRKGSWKGGTVGHSIEVLPGELHEAAFRRYCAVHDMAFLAEEAAA